jgi:hypothetical protein
MARTKPLKSAGLDLFDRVHRNQALVNLHFSDGELAALSGLANLSRCLLAACGFEGLRLERAIHFALALLEFELADSAETTTAFSDSPYCAPEGMDEAAFHAAKKWVSERRMAWLLAVMGTVFEDMGPILKAAATLQREWPYRQPTLRHRLTERTFALEFQDAPLQVLTWLAGNDIVSTAKFDGAMAVTHVSEQVIIRALSLWELDNMRRFLLSRSSTEPPSHFIRSLLKLDNVSVDGIDQLVGAMKRFDDPAVAGQCLVIPDHQRFGDLGDTLVRLSKLAPWIRMEIHAQSVAVGAVGALGIATLERYSKEQRARFAEESSRPTLADDVAATLAKHGFPMNAKSVYRAFKDDRVSICSRMHDYYQMVKKIGWVPPAEYPDYYQLLQAAADPPPPR